MIHYHVLPVTPVAAATQVLAGRHVLVSHRAPVQLISLQRAISSFVLDNGTFSAWRAGETIQDWDKYYAWVDEWCRHPAFDWALIPDVIDGTESQNDKLLMDWPLATRMGVPVWHLHESLDRLKDLSDGWPRVALGSSGNFSRPGSPNWWVRMNRVMETVCEGGRPRCKLHGLRMLDPNLFSKLPLASADSATVARNINLDCKWPTKLSDKVCRGLTLARRIEDHQSAGRWEPVSEAAQDLLLPDLLEAPSNA